MHRLQVILVSACLAVPAGTAVAQQGEGRVAGRVLSADSAGVAVAGAMVSIEDGVVNMQTGPDGSFRFSGLRPGKFKIIARKLGFAPAEQQVAVAAGEETSIDLVLRPRATQLAELTVIGTRADLDERRDRLAEVPGAVALVESEEIRRSRQANLKDVLGLTPGVYLQPRFGAADESQISIRGSGLRNNFHARGTNLLVNGMPYRNADGFTDFESIELLNTEAIEVYKGGNALRYGGSTLGGAINLETKTGYTARPLAIVSQGGSYGLFKGQLSSGMTRGGFDYYASYSRTSLDGYRSWSNQGRDRVNAHLGYALSPSTDLRTFYFYARVNERLPGSLSQSQLYGTPSAADPGNVAQHWGRDYDLHHLGVQLRSQLGDRSRVEISPYVQYRDIDHPIFQVIAQVSRDYGLDARYETTAPIAGRSNRFTFGVQPAWLNMSNRQYLNLAGKHGDLAKDQEDRAVSLALYAENVLSVTSRLTAVVGARLDHSIRRSQDFFLANGDQSDRRVYNPVLPKLGFLYSFPSVEGQLYGNASRSYEPPLLLELNSLSVPGFIALDGQSAWQFELGMRGTQGGIAWDVAAYDIELENEILNQNVQPFPGAPFTVPTYRNAPRTRHYGIEAGLDYRVPGTIFTRAGEGDRVRVRFAYTLARYQFVKDSSFDRNEIPGAPRHHLVAQASYSHPSGISLTPSLEWVPESYFVNSANTDRNLGWATFGLRAEWMWPRAGLTLFAAAQNLTDHVYSGSVQVDNAAGKYYEPADRRSVYAGIRYEP
ncbi:MAG: TonB-dependent receptor domain-containing protein [Gemmatimonadales bacterium]